MIDLPLLLEHYNHVTPTSRQAPPTFHHSTNHQHLLEVLTQPQIPAGVDRNLYQDRSSFLMSSTIFHLYRVCMEDNFCVVEGGYSNHGDLNEPRRVFVGLPVAFSSSYSSHDCV